MQKQTSTVTDQIGYHADSWVPMQMVMRGFTLTGQPYVIAATFSDQGTYCYPGSGHKWLVTVSHAHGGGQKVAYKTHKQINCLKTGRVPMWAINMAYALDQTL